MSQTTDRNTGHWEKSGQSINFTKPKVLTFSRQAFSENNSALMKLGYSH